MTSDDMNAIAEAVDEQLQGTGYRDFIVLVLSDTEGHCISNLSNEEVRAQLRDYLNSVPQAVIDMSKEPLQ